MKERTLKDESSPRAHSHCFSSMQRYSTRYSLKSLSIILTATVTILESLLNFGNHNFGSCNFGMRPMRYLRAVGESAKGCERHMAWTTSIHCDGVWVSQFCLRRKLQERCRTAESLPVKYLDRANCRGGTWLCALD